MKYAVSWYLVLPCENMLACLLEGTIQLFQDITIRHINKVVMIQLEYVLESCSEFAQLS